MRVKWNRHLDIGVRQRCEENSSESTDAKNHSNHVKDDSSSSFLKIFRSKKSSHRDPADASAISSGEPLIRRASLPIRLKRKNRNDRIHQSFNETTDKSTGGNALKDPQSEYTYCLVHGQQRVGNVDQDPLKSLGLPDSGNSFSRASSWRRTLPSPRPANGIGNVREPIYQNDKVNSTLTKSASLSVCQSTDVPDRQRISSFSQSIKSLDPTTTQTCPGKANLFSVAKSFFSSGKTSSKKTSNSDSSSSKLKRSFSVSDSRTKPDNLLPDIHSSNGRSRWRSVSGHVREPATPEIGKSSSKISSKINELFSNLRSSIKSLDRRSNQDFYVDERDPEFPQHFAENCSVSSLVECREKFNSVSRLSLEEIGRVASGCLLLPDRDIFPENAHQKWENRDKNSDDISVNSMMKCDILTNECSEYLAQSKNYINPNEIPPFKYDFTNNDIFYEKEELINDSLNHPVSDLKYFKSHADKNNQQQTPYFEEARTILNEHNTSYNPSTVAEGSGENSASFNLNNCEKLYFHIPDPDDITHSDLEYQFQIEPLPSSELRDCDNDEYDEINREDARSQTSLDINNDNHVKNFYDQSTSCSLIRDSLMLNSYPPEFIDTVKESEIKSLENSYAADTWQQNSNTFCPEPLTVDFPLSNNNLESLSSSFFNGISTLDGTIVLTDDRPIFCDAVNSDVIDTSMGGSNSHLLSKSDVTSNGIENSDCSIPPVEGHDQALVTLDCHVIPSLNQLTDLINDGYSNKGHLLRGEIKDNHADEFIDSSFRTSKAANSDEKKKILRNATNENAVRSEESVEKRLESDLGLKSRDYVSLGQCSEEKLESEENFETCGRYLPSFHHVDGIGPIRKGRVRWSDTHESVLVPAEGGSKEEEEEKKSFYSSSSMVSVSSKPAVPERRSSIPIPISKPHRTYGLRKNSEEMISGATADPNYFSNTSGAITELQSAITTTFDIKNYEDGVFNVSGDRYVSKLPYKWTDLSPTSYSKGRLKNGPEKLYENGQNEPESQIIVREDDYSSSRERPHYENLFVQPTESHSNSSCIQNDVDNFKEEEKELYNGGKCYPANVNNVNLTNGANINNFCEEGHATNEITVPQQVVYNNVTHLFVRKTSESECEIIIEDTNTSTPTSTSLSVQHTQEGIDFPELISPELPRDNVERPPTKRNLSFEPLDNLSHIEVDSEVFQTSQLHKKDFFISYDCISSRPNSLQNLFLHKCQSDTKLLFASSRDRILERFNESETFCRLQHLKAREKAKVDSSINEIINSSKLETTVLSSSCVNDSHTSSHVNATSYSSINNQEINEVSSSAMVVSSNKIEQTTRVTDIVPVETPCREGDPRGDKISKFESSLYSKKGKEIAVVSKKSTNEIIMAPKQTSLQGVGQVLRPNQGNTPALKSTRKTTNDNMTGLNKGHIKGSKVSRIPRKQHGHEGRPIVPPKPIRPPMWLSKAELTQEIQHLSSLCETRTKELNRLKMQTKHVTNGFDALAIAIRYMTEDLKAFENPSLLSNLKQTQEKVNKEKKDLECYEKKIAALNNLHAKEMGEMLETLTRKHEMAIQELVMKHTTEMNFLQEQHKTEIASFAEALQASCHEEKLQQEKLIEDLRKELKQQKEEVEMFHQQELDDLEERYREEQNALKEEIKKLQKQLAEAKQTSFSIEETLQKDTDAKLHWLSEKRNDLQKEVESLKAVLEIKNNELHALRKENLEMQKELEELPLAKERIKMLQARAEDLQALMSEKVTLERSLSSECKVIKESYEKSSKLVKRLSMENEELQWRLKEVSESSLLLPAPEDIEINSSEDLNLSDEIGVFEDELTPSAKASSPVSTSKPLFFTYMNEEELALSSISPRSYYKPIKPCPPSSSHKSSPARVIKSSASSPRKSKGSADSSPHCGGGTPRKIAKHLSRSTPHLKKQKKKSNNEEKLHEENIPESFDLHITGLGESLVSSASSENSVFEPSLLEEHGEEICKTLKHLQEETQLEFVCDVPSPSYDSNDKWQLMDEAKEIAVDQASSIESIDPKTFYHVAFPVLRESESTQEVESEKIAKELCKK